MNTFTAFVFMVVFTIADSLPTQRQATAKDKPLAPDHTEHDLFDDILKANQADSNGTEQYTEGDILPDSDIGARSRRAAIIDSDRLWPNGIVHYSVASSMLYPQELRDAMDEIESKTCIRFVEYNGQQSHVLYIQSGSGCSSYLGKYLPDPNSIFQPLNLGSGCGRVGIAQHELMHALGFHHEQSRPDRDTYVTINYENIAQGYAEQFNKMPTTLFQTFTPYDYESVMHYSSHAFTGNGQATIVPKPNPFVPIGQRNGISTNDVQDMYQLYNCLSAGNLDGAWGRWGSYGPCSVTCGNGTRTRSRACNNPKPLNNGRDCIGSDTESITCNAWSCVPGGPSSCNFETGMCSWTSSSATGQSQLEWERSKGPTPSLSTGPSVDHTLGTSSGYYVYVETSGKTPYAQGYLQSPLLPDLGSNGKRCLSFWYHMYGVNMGYLIVQYQNSYVWHTYGNKYDSWHYKRQTISATTAGKVQFIAMRGWSFTNDMALDDITITDGAC